MKHTATSLPLKPAVEQKIRTRRYIIIMSVRTLCFLTIPFIPIQWVWLSAIGAIFLPYVAVVLANNSKTTAQKAEEPEPLGITSLKHEEAKNETIIIDNKTPDSRI